MIIKRLFLILGLAGLATVLYTAPAAAQASRTWVSGVGDDVNPCSRTAPCKTFAGAISKTAAGGEINCLDPAGWGAVTITKAMTIDCSQFPGSINNTSGSNGIVVNAAGTDNVTIRGLEINGTSTSPGLNGIRFLAGASLTVEQVIIRNEQASNGSGIAFVPSTAAKLYLNNVTILSSGNGSGGGILLQPTGSGSATMEARDVRLFNGSTPGIKVDVTGLTGGNGVVLNVTNSAIVGNSQGIFLFAPAASTTPIKAMIVGTDIASNTSPGLLMNGTTITTLVSNSTISYNGQGVINAGGTLLSYQDNRLFGNGTNNTFPATINKQ